MVAGFRLFVKVVPCLPAIVLLWEASCGAGAYDFIPHAIRMLIPALDYRSIGGRTG